ncbi:MAG: cation:proton antiporter [Ignavibacteriales bacterium]|nr:cation:proton antiporter [Ignavibacteriales bacterium]
MDIAPVIIFVGMLVFLAHLFVALFERTRVPDVLYLIVIGLVLGPLLKFIQPEDFGKVGRVFTTIALVVILFEGGLELSIDMLKKTWRSSVLITVLSYVISFGVLAVGTYYLTPLSLVASLFTSAVLAGPAPSVVIPLVRHLQLKESSKTTMMVEAPLGEAICIVIALAVLESYKVADVSLGKVAGALVSSFVFAVVIGVAGGSFWSLLLDRMRDLRHAIFTTPSFLFILFGLAEFLHYSGPVTALAFGITLGNAGLMPMPAFLSRTKLTPMVHNETERLFFGEIVFLLKTFFFVYLGLSIRLTDFWPLGIGLALSLLLLASRFVAVRLSFSRDPDKGDMLMMSFLIPKGTAAAVLASIPLQSGIAGGELIQNMVYSVVVISIILTSLLIFLLERTSLITAASATPVGPARSE